MATQRAVARADRGAPAIGTRFRPPLSSARLIGRADQLELLAHLAVHTPSLAVIEGEAGIGKSRMVAELFARPELVGRRRLLGRCHPLREPFPLGPVVEALRGLDESSWTRRATPLAGVLRPLLPELASHLPPEPRLGGDPRSDRHLLFRALLEVLESLGPSVCVLEDLHWADEATVEFLHFLACQIPENLTVVASYRREDLRRDSLLLGLVARAATDIAGAYVHIAPLDVGGVRDLVAAILSAEDVSEEFAAYLHERTSGIPFAVEEVLRLVQERQDMTQLAGVWVRRDLRALEVPPAIRDAVLERVGRLSEEAQRIAEAASVLEVPSTEELLLELADGTPGGLSEALDGAVMFEVDPALYGFRHSLASQAVYQGIPRPTRRRLHLRASELLAGQVPPPVGRLAHHCREAGDTAAWLVHAEAAADVAVAVHDDATAAGLLHDILLLPEVAPADRTRLARKLAKAALLSTTPPVATCQLLHALVDDATLPAGDRGEIRGLLGLLHVSAGDATAGHREFAMAVRELGDRPRAAVSVMINLSAPWVVEGHLSEHERWLDEAVACAARSGDASARLAAALAQAIVPLYAGDRRGCEALERIDWTQATETGQLMWAAANLVGASFHVGHYERAQAWLADAGERAAELGWGPLLHVSESAQLLLDWVRGEWSGLDARARRQANALSEFPGWSVSGQLVTGRLALARGDLDRAETVLRQAFTAAAAAGVVPGLSIAAGGLARAALERSDPARAVEEAGRGLDVVASKGIWAWAAEVAPAAVEALLRCERRDEAGLLTRRLAAGIRDRDTPLARSALTGCRAMLADADGRHLRAAALYSRCERDLGSLPRPYDAARATVARARCLLRAGSTEPAGAALAAALASFDALGATADTGRIRRLLRRHSIALPSPWRGGRRGYGSQLSPREREIVDLAAQGLTNSDIGRALFISARTVEHHLSAAMQKVGVRSRTALVGRIREVDAAVEVQK